MALAASLGALALCTAASSPQSGGALAPAPAATPAPAPATVPAGDGGGTAAPEPEAAPPAPPLEATIAQDVPLQEENEELQLDAPPERKPQPRKKDSPDVPALREMGAVEGASAGSAGRLAQTGVDARLLGAAGTFLIGVGLAMLAPTLPVRRL